MKHITLALAGFSLLAIIGQGCPLVQNAGESYVENQMEKQIEAEHGGDADVDVSEGSVNMKTDDGVEVSMGKTATFPDNFPSDIPVYPNGNLIFASVDEEDGNFGYSMETDDSRSKIISWFKNELGKQGYGDAKMNLNADKMSITGYEKIEDGKTVRMNVTATEGNENINIVVSKNVE